MDFLKFVKKIFCSFDFRKPIIKDNTFLVWEPCSKSHAEIVPGYVKYLLDLGYHVSVLITPKRYEEGLFERFKDDNVSFNKLSQKEIRKFFKKSDLSDVRGVLVTTIAKLCDEVHFDDAYNAFNKKADRSKIFFVAHEAKYGIDEGTWNEKFITLRELDYKGAKSVVVNPNYFGDIKITPKNNDVVNFVTIGAIRAKRKNNSLIINSVKGLVDKGYKNFKVTVIGKGHIKDLPKELHPYIDIKGRLPFDKMYEEIEKADFMLTSYNEDSEAHRRYITTGTSGNFQLIYAFRKPCLMIESFAPLNGFSNDNAILYKSNDDYVSAMEKGINMTNEEYTNLQENLRQYTENLYSTSKESLRNLIATR